MSGVRQVEGKQKECDDDSVFPRGSKPRSMMVSLGYLSAKARWDTCARTHVNRDMQICNIEYIEYIEYIYFQQECCDL